MVTVTFCAAFMRIEWSNDAAKALTEEVFESINDLGLVNHEFLQMVCKKIRFLRAAAPAADGNVAVVAVPPVN
jgi:hypothetical protein